MIFRRYQLKYDAVLFFVSLFVIGMPVGSLAWLSTTPTLSWHTDHHRHTVGTAATTTTRLGMSPPQHQQQQQSTTTTRSNNNRIIACSSTKELAQAVTKYVQPHHTVAELGSQLREVSTAICESAKDGHIVLVDVQRKVPKAVIESQARTDAMRLETNVTNNFYPNVDATFIEIPQLQAWPQAFFDQQQQQQPHNNSNNNNNINNNDGYDVLVLDVNAIVGNDLEWTSLAVIQQFESINNNRNKKNLLVLVKSAGLTKFASRLVHAVHWKGTAEHQSTIPPPHIVATVGVQEYRHTIPHTVTSNDDVVLEVGCHFGTSTAILKNYSDHVLGVDVGSKIIKKAQLKYPEIHFRVGDAWKTAQLLRLQQECLSNNNNNNNNNNDNSGTARLGFDVVYVDVGGLSGADGLLEAINLVSSIQHALEPRTIVIKSLCMQRLSSKLVPFWQLLKREQEGRQVPVPRLLVQQKDGGDVDESG
jgi:hypothetical protein